MLYNHKLEDVFVHYQKACDWFCDLGFDFSKTRYGKYKTRFEEFQDFGKGNNLLNVSIDYKRAFDNAYIEANKIIRVHSDLKEIAPDEFMQQVKKILNGQELRAQVENDKARDFLFELSTAARFIRAGYKVKLKEITDIVVEILPDLNLYVECKRVRSERKISENLKKANMQIITRIKENNNLGLGLLAIDITDILPPVAFNVYDSPAIGSGFHRERTNVYLESKKRAFKVGIKYPCLGVMCVSEIMVYLSEHAPMQGFLFSRHTNFFDYSKDPLFKMLIPALSDQDILS